MAEPDGFMWQGCPLLQNVAKGRSSHITEELYIPQKQCVSPLVTEEQGCKLFNQVVKFFLQHSYLKKSEFTFEYSELLYMFYIISLQHKG